MSTSGTSHEETAQEVALLKEQMAEMMRMMQQLGVGGGLDSFSHSQGDPQIENENQPPPVQDQGHNVPPQGYDQEIDPSRDKNPESGYGQVKSQVETLVKKVHIIKGTSAHGSVDSDSLTNFLQAIMPPKFKALEFVKYDGTRDPCAHLRMFYRKMAPYGDNHLLLCQIFPYSLTGPVATWYARLEKTSSQRERANSFLEYYKFNIEIAPDRTVLQRIKKKSGESFREYAQRWRELAASMQPPMMENEMVKRFIDNLKPPYYVKMINTQVTHFASLIPIGERIDEGIRSKKIMDAESLSFMVEQQVKKMTSYKTNEANVHMVDNASKRPKGVASTNATLVARSYQQQNQPA